ncbi:TetR family transcriptional regulator [Actinocorallia herbida]|uniref:TetR family transcriptional regulator n=1 Tax=Actinocorallia herbida TaxID=58109 RepID=A0A3N1CW58_9ACTN|nr:TetR/AcrR family transcriptional regulator C-terminal domain-containing protein [Actinocorallia herbida]ROO84958.1 TetR family transcriptional regulator [Actinocorallia herbida]
MSAEKPESLWERLERPSPAPRQTLSPQRIAATAVAIADAESLEAVTMRRLAGELGVAPMAPYRYVSGKDDLLELMVDHAYADLRLPGGLGWRETLHDLAMRTRELILAHRWLAQLSPRAKLALTPNRMAVTEQVLAALQGHGLDADTTMSVFRSVAAYVEGAMGYECAVSALIREEGLSGGPGLRTELAPAMTWLIGTGRYPAFEAYLHAAARKDDARWQFTHGLDCLLEGIATRLGI